MSGWLAALLTLRRAKKVPLLGAVVGVQLDETVQSLLVVPVH